ncbi:MAG: hypothetical protein GY768_23660 [Planctomycetaceae bacterium]|nr:hypothetical protein [Planctomycetaceae bacterium]
MSHDQQRSKLRAPSGDRESLIDPPLSQVDTWLQRNRLILDRWEFDFAGQSPQALRSDVRSYLLTQAQQYTAAYRDVSLPTRCSAESFVVLTGHQPELFHAGVWFKNFVLDRIARKAQAVPIHLIIDNDIPKTTAICVPAGTIAKPTIQTIALEQPTALPFEERLIQDASLYQSFDQRVATAVHELVSDPLLLTSWQESIEADKAENNLGYRLARFRHRQEAKMGLQTLELPLSSVCDHSAFHVFVANLFSRYEQVHQIYNESLMQHRLVNRIRSKVHPVPDLTRHDDWCELPFWVWTDSNPHRRALFVRRHQRQFELTDLNAGSSWGLGESELAIGQQLSKLRSQGVKIRPRALMTTLFARLFLSDLFVHGIGGGKYDELTDLLVFRLFQVDAPGYLTATSTFRLPIERTRVTARSLAKLKQQLHQLRYHPEKFLPSRFDGDDQVAALVAQKYHWIRQQLPRGQRQQRHDGIEAANSSLRSFVESDVTAIEVQLANTIQALQNRAILASREYSFCLFPFRQIRDGLIQCLLSDA